MPLLLFLATLGVTAAVAVTLIAARLYQRRMRELAGPLALALAGWCALYATLLVHTSIASEPRILRLEEPKQFCGFYLDCHLHAAVADIDSSRRLGTGTDAVSANGTFIIVTLRISSDARREPTHFVGPRAVIRDDRRRVFPRSMVAERALSRISDGMVPLTERVEAGSSFVTRIVFDVPTDAEGLMLDLTDGYSIDRVIESLLIGDDDSVFHAPTLFRLTR